MKWSDLLRIKAEFPVNLWPNAAQAYHRWVLASLAANKPYDQFARELLTASGSNFRVGPANFYRAIQNRKPDGIATAVALTLMGTRAEMWPAERLAGMAVFFSQVGFKPTSEWKEEHVFWDPLGTSTAAGNTAPGRAAVTAIGTTPPPAPATPATPAAAAAPLTPRALAATFPDGTKLTIPPDRDPRELFADWLISPQNPWFTRNIANRVWSWLVGRGIIHEADDIRPDNPPSNPALLAYLEQELIASRYDLKHLYRLILNSQTYQFSPVPPSARPAAAANFASYPLRRLEAEVLIDAINRITGTTDLYTSPIPEPFTYIPEDQPAVAIADGSITSPVPRPLRPLRPRHRHGKRTRQQTRPGPVAPPPQFQPHPAQTGARPQTARRFGKGPAAAATVEELYLTVLSRFPTPAEI
jgi:hypothetical protein